MGMPVESENKRQIAADGTIFEILDDGTIKRIGKLSQDGKFEPFGGIKEGIREKDGNVYAIKKEAEHSESVEKNETSLKRKIFVLGIVLSIVSLLVYLCIMASDLGSFEYALVDLCEDLSRNFMLPLGCDNAPEAVHVSGTVGGLQWSYPSEGRMSWNDAVKYCKNLDQNGFLDWRLPTINELMILLHNRAEGETRCYPDFPSGYFSKFRERGDFWSSSKNEQGSPLYLYFECGVVWSSGENNYVRCVR